MGKAVIAAVRIPLLDLVERIFYENRNEFDAGLMLITIRRYTAAVIGTPEVMYLPSIEQSENVTLQDIQEAMKLLSRQGKIVKTGSGKYANCQSAPLGPCCIRYCVTYPRS